MEELRLWVLNSPLAFQRWLSDPPVLEFLRQQRRKSFHMQGAYDGAMSEDCKKLFADEYNVLSVMVERGEHIDEIAK